MAEANLSYSKMKILQTISFFGTLDGGTSTCTYDLIHAMNSQGYPVDLLTLQTASAADRLMGNGEPWIKALPYDACSPYAYSRNIASFLRHSRYDLYHTNGLWLYCNHATCATARRQGKPYVITPHGMLYPDALRRSYWKKWPLIQLFFHKDILHASCMHATCKEEMEHIRSFGYCGPVAVIPNPVVIPPYVGELTTLPRNPKTIGFLGRLHPIKKVENILYGLARLQEGGQSLKLLIMGKGDAEYEKFLHVETERLKLSDEVEFCGFMDGREKYERLASLSALFVPSDFENFGMIVTEALAVGTPVMASLGTPWEILNTQHCGWWADRSPESIAHVMRQVLAMSDEELHDMGERGRKLVNERFRESKVAAMMHELYQWLLDEIPQPSFIHTL